MGVVREKGERCAFNWRVSYAKKIGKDMKEGGPVAEGRETSSDSRLGFRYVSTLYSQ
jgi:hypothetical protein